jgi:hypothetical protein
MITALQNKLETSTIKRYSVAIKQEYLNLSNTSKKKRTTVSLIQITSEDSSHLCLCSMFVCDTVGQVKFLKVLPKGDTTRMLLNSL